MTTQPFFVPGHPEQGSAVTDVNYRWATVTQTTPLRVRLDGDSTALPVTPENLTGEDLPVGARVWVQFYGRRILVLGAAGGQFTSTLLRNLPAVATGGGIVDCTQTAIGWSERFILLGAGHTPQIPSGFFDIQMPPDGAVVHGLGNIGDRTVAGGLIDAGVNTWFAIWYALPPPGSLNSTYSTNFYITGYTADFTVPSNWVCVAVHNPEAEGNVWRLIDGRLEDPWRTPSYLNGWATYGNPYAPVGYKKIGSVVYLRGLVKDGTVATGTTGTIFTLPAGFRPAFETSYSVMAGNTFGRLDVLADGSVRAMSGPTSTYYSLDNVRFIAEQ